MERINLSQQDEAYIHLHIWNWFCLFPLPLSLSRVQQTISVVIMTHRDRQELSLEQAIAKKLLWRSNFKQICFELLTKGGYLNIFKCNSTFNIYCFVAHVAHVSVHIHWWFVILCWLGRWKLLPGGCEQSVVLVCPLKLVLCSSQSHVTLGLNHC